MNRNDAVKLVFDVLNRELIKPGSGSDTMARAVIDALMVAGAPLTNERTRHNLIGFQIISDMTREELILECLAFHRMHCETVTNEELKLAVVNSRTVMYQRRLAKEAKLNPPGNPFAAGWGNTKVDD